MAAAASMPPMPMPMPAHHRTLSSVSSSAEDLFSSITGFDDLANDDDLSLDDIEEDGNGKGGPGAKKGRRLASTAEKKATHNAVERARRESLNVRFLVLADMLPGMNHVKRASKAGIVNKSIALIQELQATEKRLGTENEALKAELEMLRQQAAQAGAAAAAAAAAAGMMPPMHFHAMQSMNGMNGMPNMSGMMQQQPPHHPHHQHSMSVPQQQVQQAMNLSAPSANDANNVHSRRSSAPSGSGMPVFPGYAGMFGSSGEASNENGGAASAIKSEPAASPASDISKPSGNDLFANSLFDFTSMTSGGMPVTDLTGQALSSSPASFTGNSPPGTVASLISDKAASSSNGNMLSNNNNNNPSPASSHSISTPGNTFSPAPLSFDPSSSTTAAVASSSTSSPPNNPVLAAFDSTSDAAFLAAQFAPRDLAKAQSELQAFMAYQQRMAAMAAAGAGMGFPNSPNTPSFSLPQQQQQQSPPHPPQNHNFGAGGMPNMNVGGGMGGFPFSNVGQFQHPQGMCAPQGGPLAGIPAWQMMMAQQQALSTYGGLGHQF